MSAIPHRCGSERKNGYGLFFPELKSTTEEREESLGESKNESTDEFFREGSIIKKVMIEVMFVVHLVLERMPRVSIHLVAFSVLNWKTGFRILVEAVDKRVFSDLLFILVLDVTKFTSFIKKRHL